MLKKILAIVAFSFVLAGCGEEVTEDMLIGKWECNYLGESARAEYDEKGNIGEFKIVKEDPGLSVILTYKKEAGIMTVQANETEPRAFYFKTKPEFEVDSSEPESEYKLSVNYIFISNDEFRTEFHVLNRDAVSKQNLDEIKSGGLCTRISD